VSFELLAHTVPVFLTFFLGYFLLGCYLLPLLFVWFFAWLPFASLVFD